jgi:RES domain-containing protein
MIVFRLCSSRYSSDLSGKGAERTGGRWNSKGVPMIYTSATRALCITEIAVHTPLGNIPVNYNSVSIEVPEAVRIVALNETMLPPDWKSFPHSHSTQEIGDRFIAEEIYAVMRVPSVIVQDEYNYLINPAHKDIKKIKISGIEKFEFDQRLFRK